MNNWTEPLKIITTHKFVQWRENDDLGSGMKHCKEVGFSGRPPERAILADRELRLNRVECIHEQ